MHWNDNSDTFDDSHLDIDFKLPSDVGEMLFPDIYVGLNIDLLATGDVIVTDHHHSPTDQYEADGPENQIASQISSFTLSGWLRYGCEQVVQTAGATACRPGELDADYMLDDVYDRDLDSGYHEKGSCVDDEADEDTHTGCVIYDLFGAFGNRAGRVIRRPIRFSSIRRQVDMTQGEAEAHYRQLNTQVRSRNEGQQMQQKTVDVVGTLMGTWWLTLRELRPEYVGLLVEAIDYLDAHSDDYEMQLGGSFNFRANIVDAKVINPLYTEAELRRVYNRSQVPTGVMESKDDTWRSVVRNEFVRALQARTAAGDGGLPVPEGGDGS